jgi:hypothetical protein
MAGQAKCEECLLACLFTYLLDRGEEEAAWRAPPWGCLGWCGGRSALHVLHGLSVGGGQARRGEDNIVRPQSLCSSIR